MDGEYDNETEVAEGSNIDHPMYQTYYVSKSGDIWTIYVIDGSVFAYPVSFNWQSNLGVEMLVSESNEIISYDDETNKFYVTIPHESTLIVKTVKKIDAETLDKLTVEELGK